MIRAWTENSYILFVTFFGDELCRQKRLPVKRRRIYYREHINYGKAKKIKGGMDTSGKNNHMYDIRNVHFYIQTVHRKGHE